MGMNRALMVAVCSGLALPAGEVRDQVRWGSPEKGLRLGLKMGDLHAGDELSVLFQNVGATRLRVLLGAECGVRTYNVRFTLRRGQQECELTGDPEMAYCAGALLQIVPELAPGQTTEIHYDAGKLVCRRPAGRTPVSTLREQGYGLSAVFVGNRPTKMGKDSGQDVWVGRLEVR